MRKHFIFHGTVQGVGFRWRACNAANACGVTGFVRNLSDGTVEMEAEGPSRAIDETVRMIERGGYIVIDSMDVEEIPEKGDRSFRTEWI